MRTTGFFFGTTRDPDRPPPCDQGMWPPRANSVLKISLRDGVVVAHDTQMPRPPQRMLPDLVVLARRVQPVVDIGVPGIEVL